MEAKSVAFDSITEAEAAVHLFGRNHFYMIYAYRELFEKRVGGLRTVRITLTEHAGSDILGDTFRGYCCCPLEE